MGRAIDLFVTYRFLRLLTTPFEDTDAFKLGIIDEKGNRVKLPKSTKPAGDDGIGSNPADERTPSAASSAGAGLLKSAHENTKTTNSPSTTGVVPPHCGHVLGTRTKACRFISSRGGTTTPSKRRPWCDRI